VPRWQTFPPPKYTIASNVIDRLQKLTTIPTSTTHSLPLFPEQSGQMCQSREIFMPRLALCVAFVAIHYAHGFSFSATLGRNPFRACAVTSCHTRKKDHGSAKPSILSTARCSSSGMQWEDDMRGKALVSTSWLAERLGSPDVAILDVRGEVGKEDKGSGLVVTSYQGLKEAYLQSHIPGAVFGT
jgi:hypothetical protein